MITTSTLTYILHAKPFKETSLLINLFSREQGRFSVLAKGVKRKNSQALRAILQPFNLIDIEYSGKSNLKTLCHAELTGKTVHLPNRSLICGYYLNELLIRSLQEWQEFVSLFTHYHETINKLDKDNDLAAILRNFEVMLLAELGLAPQWHLDIHGENICSEAQYYFIPEQGFALHSDKVDDSSVAISGKLMSGEALLCLSQGYYNPKVMKRCQKITQQLLKPVIGNQPLESRKLWL